MQLFVMSCQECMETILLQQCEMHAEWQGMMRLAHQGPDPSKLGLAHKRGPALTSPDNPRDTLLYFKVSLQMLSTA